MSALAKSSRILSTKKLQTLIQAVFFPDKLTGQTEGHIPWICLSEGDPPAVHSHYTHRSSALPEGPFGSLPSLSLTTKGS